MSASAGSTSAPPGSQNPTAAGTNLQTAEPAGQPQSQPQGAGARSETGLNSPGALSSLGGLHCTALRVRYAETDAMGVAHHAVYPVWFEVGRSDLMRHLGLSYAEVEAQGYYLMLTDLGVQYRRAARYDEELALLTRVDEVRSRTLRFGYELRGPGGDLLASGHTAHIVTDHQYRPQRLPDTIRQQLEQVALPEPSGMGAEDTP